MKLLISEFLLAVTIPAGVTIILHLIFRLSTQECFSLGMLLGFISGGIWLKKGQLNQLSAKLSALYKEWF